MTTVSMSDELAHGRVINAMLNGDAPLDEDGAVAAAVALTYAESCRDRGRKRAARKAKVTADEAQRGRLLDVIMHRSYAGEDLRMSLARVAKAVAVIGFPTVNAFTAWCAYHIFPELEKEEYNGGRGNGTAEARRAR